MTSNLLILRGIPGSGKSTIAEALVKAGLYDEWVEADEYFITEWGYLWEASKVPDAHQWCFTEVFRLLSLGKNVIVANTFVKPSEYQKYVDKAKEIGYNISMAVVSSNNFESVHGVPEATIKRMKQSLVQDKFLLTS